LRINKLGVYRMSDELLKETAQSLKEIAGLLKQASVEKTASAGESELNKSILAQIVQEASLNVFLSEVADNV
jgi:hypothetical protein